MARRIGMDLGRDRKRLGWAWVLFLITLLFLWVAFNALFMVPGRHVGQYDTFGVSVAVVSIVVASLVAWASGRLFMSARYRGKKTRSGVLSTPPMLACVAVLLIFVSLLLAKLF